MVMRYHWGLAVGHIYSHGQHAGIATAATAEVSTNDDVNDPELETNTMEEVDPLQLPDDEPDVDDPVFGLENNEDPDHLEEFGFGQDSEDELGGELSESDEMLAAMGDMYGYEGVNDYYD
jgi:hypothetical protein